MKVIEDLLGHRIAVEIDETSPDGHCREKKLANLERAAAKTRNRGSGHRRSPGPRRHGSSEDEGTHQDRAQVSRVGLDEGEQPVSRQSRSPRLASSAREWLARGRASGEGMFELARLKEARAIRRDELFTVARWDRMTASLSLGDDEERGLLLAGPRGPHRRGLPASEGCRVFATRCDLRRGGQRGPELIVTGRKSRGETSDVIRADSFIGPFAPFSPKDCACWLGPSVTR